VDRPTDNDHHDDDHGDDNDHDDNDDERSTRRGGAKRVRAACRVGGKEAMEGWRAGGRA
jgi:hypothetical protein